METTVEVLPPVDTVVATDLLEKVDNLVNWKNSAVAKIQVAHVRMSRYIADIVTGSYWIVRGYANEAEYVAKTFAQSDSQYHILRRTGLELREYPLALLEEIGISKCQDLVRLKRRDGHIEMNWFVYAKTEKRDCFRARVRAYLGNLLLPAAVEEDEIVHFRVWRDAKPIFTRAFEIGKLLAGNNESKSYVLLGIILPEFLATYTEDGASLVSENNFHLSMIRRHINHLKLDNDATVLDRLIGEVRGGIADKKEK
jgi:hypothetical protein